MWRWDEDQLREYHQKRQGRAAANQEARQHQKDVKRPKYGNKKVSVGGHTFDSKAEAAHFVDLTRQQEAGLISGLRCQVPFDLVVNGTRVCRYIADFVYLDADRHRVVCDVKGFRTREYQLKKKLMYAIHGISIAEVRKSRKTG